MSVTHFTAVIFEDRSRWRTPPLKITTHYTVSNFYVFVLILNTLPEHCVRKMFLKCSLINERHVAVDWQIR